MKARTIQHPGIEINEIDLTEYRDTVTTNNAYVIGFTDRGPIYDYSWITTRSEFINLYGEPQNEAEKYLYYAVQSILNNGGTPIVARMPYDNKQCKAYKGLKIRYAAYKEDKNSDTGYIIYNWENDAAFPQSGIPLIELDKVGQYINPDGFDSVYDALVNQDVKIINYPSSILSDDDVAYNSISSGSIGKLTYKDLLCNLAPKIGVELSFMPSGQQSPYGESEDAVYDYSHDAITNIENILAFLKVDAHPEYLKTVSGVMTLNSYEDLSGALTNIDTEFNDSEEIVKKYGRTSYKMSIGRSLSGLIDIFNYYCMVDPNMSMDSTINSSTYTPPATDEDPNPDPINIPTYFKQNTPKRTLEKFSEKLYNLIKNIIDTNTREGINISSYASAKDELNLLKIYLRAKSESHNKTVSGVLDLLSGTYKPMFKHLLDCKLYDDTKEPVVELTGKYLTIDSILDEYDDSYYLSGNYEVPTAVSGKWTSEPALSATFKFYFPEGSGYISSWIDALDQEIEDSSLSIPGEFKPLLINDKYPSGLSIPEKIIASYLTGLMYDDSILSAISTINLSGVTKYQQQLDNTLALIYNDPYFKRLDGTVSGQAMVDAHLLTTNEINYRYGVFLDSKECEISNEQYDDLVTTNNFTKADMSVSKYGEDIDNANFVIVDKHKTIVDGTGSNEGYFITIIDPYDGLKMQRLLVNPKEQLVMDTMVSNATKNTLSYYGQLSEYSWKTMFKDEINTLNTLQRVKNADGIWVGEPSQTRGKEQLLDSWSVPLTGSYYDESISKSLMNMFPQIPLTDVATNASSENALCTIDKQYSSHVVIAVCKTVVNPSDGKITVSILEQFFGSLFEEKNIQNGRDLYIGNIINANSNYIEFYRNSYIKPRFGGGYDLEPYNKTAVAQFFIKDSTQLNNACKMVGIDPDIYDTENIYFEYDKIHNTWKRLPNCPPLIEKRYDQYMSDLAESNIFIFDKKSTIFYNNHPLANFTSFSKKESQKIIANTTGLFGQAAGTTANIGDNFIIDMDRCINFIKNIDDIPIYFVADAGLSTIAQFCDNVVWDQSANNGNGKWVTQNFDPDNDPDAEDRYITGYEDVATWRKVVDKLDQISREIRRDCMTIIDAPRQLTLDGSAPKIRRSRPQFSWDEMVGEKLRFISGINSSYCAGYYNWLRTTDDFSGKSFWLPPTCKIIGNYMYLNIINLPWLAPAGLTYGVLTGIHGISHNPSPNEEDQIYLKSWNYIKQYPFDGFIIEGQKTTLTKNSAFNRVNVRTLFLDLERFVYNVARNFKYQVNNSYTREQFVQTIKPKFEDYMIRGGLYDYLIKCDDTNNTPETIDANELRCAIYLKPARLIEFILIDMVAAKTGANLEEIAL